VFNEVYNLNKMQKKTKKFFKDNLDLAGALDGSRAYKGPNIVQIDLTDKCNLNCVGCWCHSDFLGESKLIECKELPYKLVKKLIEDLHKIGVKEIMLSGSGEPFMYPKIMEVITSIKQKGIKLNIVTNFTLVNKKIIEKLVELKVDNITASIWAGDAKTYVKTHPNQNEKTFERIRENLKFLHSLKKEKNLPHVKIYNVISKFNYGKIENMINFALDTLVDYIEFQVIDAVQGKTEFLMLSESKKLNLFKQFRLLLKRDNCYAYDVDSFLINKKFLDGKLNKEIKEFPGRFIKIPLKFILKVSEGDKDGKKCIMRVLTCPLNKTTWPPKEDNPKIREDKNLYIFRFNPPHCKLCESFDTCPVNDKGEIGIKYLSILGFGSFYRRISNESLREAYDSNIIDSIPCYVGWIYARILTNGDVIPCCKAHLFPLGNLYKNSFKSIWFSEKYNEFRKKAKNTKKSDPYFKRIECYKGCDNLGINLEFHKRIKELHLLQKDID